MKYATQITNEQPKGSAWKPGLHRFRTKREAEQFTSGVNETGGKARTMRQRDERIGWEPTSEVE